MKTIKITVLLLIISLFTVTTYVYAELKVQGKAPKVKNAEAGEHDDNGTSVQPNKPSSSPESKKVKRVDCSRDPDKQDQIDSQGEWVGCTTKK